MSENALKISDLLEFAKHVSPTAELYVRDDEGNYLSVTRIVLEKEEGRDLIDLVIEVEQDAS